MMFEKTANAASDMRRPIRLGSRPWEDGAFGSEPRWSGILNPFTDALQWQTRCMPLFPSAFLSNGSLVEFGIFLS